MLALLAALGISDPASLKRTIATGIGAAVLMLSPFLQSKGLPVPSETVQLALAGLISAFILQSGAKSAVVAHAEAVAATPAPTPTEAEASLRAAVEAGAKTP